MDKERRDELSGDILDAEDNDAVVVRVGVVRNLLDMDAERDQLRALLERAWYYVERGGNPELLNAIDAALEGNDGD